MSPLVFVSVCVVLTMLVSALIQEWLCQVLNVIFTSRLEEKEVTLCHNHKSCWRLTGRLGGEELLLMINSDCSSCPDNLRDSCSVSSDFS